MHFEFENDMIDMLAPEDVETKVNDILNVAHENLKNYIKIESAEVDLAQHIRFIAGTLKEAKYSPLHADIRHLIASYTRYMDTRPPTDVKTDVKTE